MATTNRITPDDRPALPNGHAGRHVNGRGRESAPRDSAPSESAIKNLAPQARARAAADDAHGTPDAPASAPPAASANRADDAVVARDSKVVAPEPPTAKGRRSSGAKNNTDRSAKNGPADSKKNESKEPHVPLPPGQLPLPEDAAAFVSAVHAQADLIEAGRRLLNSEDEKILKGVWDRLVNLKYGNTEEQPDEQSRRVKVGIPRPIRNKPQPPPVT